METAKLAKDLGLDIECFNELFNLYVQATSVDLKEAKAALREADAEEIHKRMHSIKGASGNLGFIELFELAKEIDERAIVNALEGLEHLIRVFDEKYEKFVEEFEKSRIKNSSAARENLVSD